MKKSSEKYIEHKLVMAIKENKGMCIKLICDQFSGLPDRLCLFPNGKVAFAELKTTGQKPRLLQTVVHNKLRKLGFTVEVIDSAENINTFINSILNKEQ